MAFETAKLLARGDVPKNDSGLQVLPILSARQHLAVRREGPRLEIAQVRCADPAQLLARGHIPQAQGMAVECAESHRFGVAGKRGGREAVTRLPVQKLTRGRVPLAYPKANVTVRRKQD